MFKKFTVHGHTKALILDEEDCYLFNKKNFFGYGTGYVGYYDKSIKNTRLVHRKILQVPSGKIIDHINGNKFDNRKSNLRICTQVENQANRHVVNKNNTSGYTGVSWWPGRKRWVSQMMIVGKQYRLGIFTEKRLAILAYKAAKKSHAT